MKDVEDSPDTDPGVSECTTLGDMPRNRYRGDAEELTGT